MLSFSFIEKNAINQGTYYLISRHHVDELYQKAGYRDDEEVPSYINIEGKNCLFTENFVQYQGKEYEIVIVANGFAWEDVLVFNDENE